MPQSLSETYWHFQLDCIRCLITLARETGAWKIEVETLAKGFRALEVVYHPVWCRSCRPFPFRVSSPAPRRIMFLHYPHLSKWLSCKEERRRQRQPLLTDDMEKAAEKPWLYNYNHTSVISRQLNMHYHTEQWKNFPMSNEQQNLQIKALSVRNTAVCFWLVMRYNFLSSIVLKTTLLLHYALAGRRLPLIATFVAILSAWYGLPLPHFWKGKMILWVFWRNSRGICVLKRFYYKAHYTIWIPDTFTMLHLSDVLLQGSTDMLYLINYLFIISKVQHEEKKAWTTSLIIQLGFTPREGFQRIRIFLLLFLPVFICLLLRLLMLQWGVCSRNSPMNRGWGDKSLRKVWFKAKWNNRTEALIARSPSSLAWSELYFGGFQSDSIVFGKYFYCLAWHQRRSHDSHCSEVM